MIVMLNEVKHLSSTLYNFGFEAKREVRHPCAHAWDLINIRCFRMMCE